jgi:hypothetical protein
MSVSRPRHPPPIQRDDPANMAALRPLTHDGVPGRLHLQGDADLPVCSGVQRDREGTAADQTVRRDRDPQGWPRRAGTGRADRS